MNIKLAQSAGYCFGVRRAIELAENSAPAWSLGPLIHNQDAVGELENKGVRAADSLSGIPKGSRVIVRSHGIGLGELQALKQDYEVVDATCPFVAAIHKMAHEAAGRGETVIICGQRAHPEVQGILGWAGERACVVADPEEARALPPMDEAFVISQTTLGLSAFEAICAQLKRQVRNLTIRSTVCDATIKRQAECEDLARESDIMLVVGDGRSANTRRLSEIARAQCSRTYLIDGAEALENIDFYPEDRIGITAGASTPRRKYEEVIAHMNDIETKVNAVDAPTTPEAATEEEDFAAQIEGTLVRIRPGQTIIGKVLQITEDEIGVGIGYKMDGILKKSDLCDTDVKVGDEIEVEVVKVNDGEGNVLLSQRNIVNRKLWDEILAKFEAGEYVTAIGKEAVKGGLLCDLGGIRTFVPASQLASRYVDKIEQFVGKELKLKIIEADRQKKRIVASRKAVLEEEAAARKAEIWGRLQKDAIVTGVVRRLTDFGAFVDIGGVDGLVHITNLNWGHPAHPSEAVSVGEEIQVKILSVDPERERVSLSRKATMPNPWTVAEEKYPVGEVVEGKVVRITAFGAFVELEPGLDGLVHISQCALTRINKVEDALTVGQIVRVKVLDVDTEKKRISLSVRAVLEDEAIESTDEIYDEYEIEEGTSDAEPEAPVDDATEAAAEPESAPAEEN